MSVQVSYKKQITIFIFLFLILLSAVEIGARILEYFEVNECEFLGKDAMKNVEKIKQNQICKDNNSIIYEVDGVLRLAPNQNMETININSYGFRGVDFSEKKDSDVYRIFIVGGSTAFGSGSTSDDTTIAAFLQEKIRESHVDQKIEIINAGIGSAYSFSEKYLIENHVIKFQPDLIIIYSGVNDAHNRFGEEYEVPGMSADIVILAPDPTDFTNKVKKVIKEINYRTPFVVSKIIGKVNAGFQINNTSKNQVQELWTSRMGEICEGNKKNGIKTIILVQPILGSGNKHLSIEEKILLENYGDYMINTLDILDKIADSLIKLENTCDGTYDLRTSFDDITESLFFDHAHVNNLGNEIIAEEINKILTNHM